MFRNLLLALPLLAVASSAYAAQYTLTVPMNGAQERPNPVNTPGTGVATVTFDDLTGVMTVNGTFQNLTANANNAHVHGYAPLGQPGQPAAGVVFGLNFTPSTSGTVSGTGTIPSDRIDDVLAGLTYINIHSVGQYSGGEIRGQIIVPEPASMALLAVPALLLMRRRR
jgi:hypothetical protein